MGEGPGAKVGLRTGGDRGSLGGLGGLPDLAESGSVPRRPDRRCSGGCLGTDPAVYLLWARGRLSARVSCLGRGDEGSRLRAGPVQRGIRCGRRPLSFVRRRFAVVSSPLSM